MYRPESRQSGETTHSVGADNLNFSRPRKPSLASLTRPDISSATHLRPDTAQTSISDSARFESRTPTMPANYIPASPGPRAGRHPSVASNMSSSSTYASAAPGLYHKSSYDRLGPYRNVSQNAAPGNYMGLPHIIPSQSPQQNRLGPYPQHQQSPFLYEDELRSSMRSQLTSSSAQDTLFTDPERASLMTRRSSVFSNNLRNRRSSFFGPHDATFDVRESLSVDDVMGMYEQGFNDSDIELSRRLSSIDPDHAEVPMVRLAPGGMDDHDDSRPGSAVSHTSEAASRLLEAMSQSNPQAIPGRSFPLNSDGSVTIRDTNAFFRKSLASSLPNDMRLSFIKSELQDIGDAFPKGETIDPFEADSGRHNRHDSGKEIGPRNEVISPIDDIVQQDEAMPIADNIEHPTEQQDEVVPIADDMEQDEASSEADDVLSPLEKETLGLPLSSAVVEIKSAPLPSPPLQGAPQPEDLDPDANDRYGFRKQNQYITRQQYDEWNEYYSEYLARRRKKWEGFLKENGLMTDKPNRFPQHSAKAKRFVRKGIPPEWRGAAWFYYAGGPKILANNQGVYDKLLKQVEGGDLKEVCREDIERDLYRTFPDNVRFRRTATTGLTPGELSLAPTPAHSRNNSTQSANPTPRASDPEIIASLRRVLSAFAIFNPSIGYCQSLNFLGGMLLLFVETEEQAFWLLNIITRVYLPGTHEMNLEGSKVDLSVLMNELQSVLPNVWTKISDDGFGTAKKKPRRGRNHRHGAHSITGENLPPVTLALTAWFMSCFIGTLPIETTLRVWDVFFYEGSKTLFRVALAIFKTGESEIKAISDPMEVFAVVQSLPRKMLDANALMDVTFKRRSGLNHLTSEALDQQRAERKEKLSIQRKEAVAAAAAAPGIAPAATIAVSRARKEPDISSINSGDSASVRRKHNLFARKNKDRGLSDV
ncbi:GTPase-activating protein gyp3 [Cytospora mali]|uniref:GTPase-activating protein gyp3 n=1 Tax=Cytospora mali TaxID=578113 RepID=A0A194USE4_CYTMA|nr:GTPase-activating protein gyp3 [Valsa mali var. pyri (nom. inval.)]